MSLQHYYTLSSHHRYLWYISYGHLGSAMVAMYYNKPFYAMTSGVASITSTIYWAKPENNWKRKLDITWIIFCYFSQLFTAHHYENTPQFYGLMLVSGLNYPISNYLLYKQQYIASTFVHGLIHIIAIIANIILYSSNAKK